MVSKVLADADVLFSRTLRDWLFMLRAETKGVMFTVHCTEDIAAEVLSQLRNKHPQWDGRQIVRIRDLLMQNVDDWVDDFHVDGSYPGKDPNDQHVHAAAVSCGAGVLLTCDSGFLGLGGDVTDLLPYEIYAPDDLFVLVDDSAPYAVHRVVTKQVQYWRSREGQADLPAALRNSGCPDFADRVLGHLQETP